MFEKLFLILYTHFTYSVDALEAIRKIEDFVNDEVTKTVSEARAETANLRAITDKQHHELLVALCLSNERVWQPAYTQKIEAIKALRNLPEMPRISLVAAKLAVEDSRVFAKSQAYHNGWVNTPDCEQ